MEHPNLHNLTQRGERIYLWFLNQTKRLSNQQIMALLAIIVGVLAGLGTYIFEQLLYGIKWCLTNWFAVEESQFLFLLYPAVGIVLASLFVRYIVKDNISEGVTRVLYAMSRKNSHIASHNCWTSVVGGATTIGFGGSVGPEAPIVLTGAAIGSNVGRLARLNNKNMTLLRRSHRAYAPRIRSDHRHLADTGRCFPVTANSALHPAGYVVRIDVLLLHDGQCPRRSHLQEDRKPL